MFRRLDVEQGCQVLTLKYMSKVLKLNLSCIDITVLELDRNCPVLAFTEKETAKC